MKISLFFATILSLLSCVAAKGGFTPPLELHSQVQELLAQVQELQSTGRRLQDLPPELMALMPCAQEAPGGIMSAAMPLISDVDCGALMEGTSPSMADSDTLIGIMAILTGGEAVLGDAPLDDLCTAYTDDPIAKCLGKAPYHAVFDLYWSEIATCAGVEGLLDETLGEMVTDQESLGGGSAGDSINPIFVYDEAGGEQMFASQEDADETKTLVLAVKNGMLEAAGITTGEALIAVLQGSGNTFAETCVDTEFDFEELFYVAPATGAPTAPTAAPSTAPTEAPTVTPPSLPVISAGHVTKSGAIASLAVATVLAHRYLAY